MSRAANGTTDVESGSLDGVGSTNSMLARSAKKELEWLRDPLKLATHIQKILKKDVDKALALVRLASKDMQCTVSWNHILNHHLAHVGPNSAWKLFNEVSRYEIMRPIYADMLYR
jgi:hypothetical protein